MIEWLIIALALAGLFISLYFTFAYYGRIKHSRWIPEIFCAREGSSCVTVVQTPYARVFGVPNSLLGIGYYAFVFGWILDDVTGWVSHEYLSAVDFDLAGVHLHFSSLLGFCLAVASAGTVILGFYLIYALRRILYIDCPLCYTAHAINLALFVLLLLSNW